jgi:hypothetical protein
MAEFSAGAAKSAVNHKFAGTVHVRVADNIQLDTLHSVIDRIVNLAGCARCGLLGVDLRLTGDPVEFQQIAELPGVSHVGLVR